MSRRVRALNSAFSRTSSLRCASLLRHSRLLALKRKMGGYGQILGLAGSAQAAFARSNILCKKAIIAFIACAFDSEIQDYRATDQLSTKLSLAGLTFVRTSGDLVTVARRRRAGPWADFN